MMRCLGRVATLLLLLSCRDSTTNLVSDPDTGIAGAAEAGVAGSGGSGGTGGTAPDAAMPAIDASMADGGGARCGGAICACDDGMDSDADGLADGFDPECTGPLDNDESSFGTGAPSPSSACRECFWDDNAGSGDDGCRYPAGCFLDPFFVGGPNCASCAPSAECSNTCLPQTPNGCDCFGCCEVAREDGTTIEIVLEDSCSLANLDDFFACPRCTRNAACQNPCGECELCPGRTMTDLPASCGAQTDPDVGHSCDNGLQTCSVRMPCQGTDYCQQGCCLLTVF